MVHRVIRGLATGVDVVDITHQIPAHDVRAGALALWRSARWLAPGVALAVVDPGVGTDRRAVALEAAGGDLVLVGPDNGLLTPAAYLFGPPARAVALPPAPGGTTFDGRDLFAPTAAMLCCGADLADLGDPLPPEELAGGPLMLASSPAEDVAARGLDVEVLWVDTYGNAELGVRPATIEALGPEVLVTVPTRTAGTVADTTAPDTTAPDTTAPDTTAPDTTAPETRVAVRARGYAELGPGRLGLVADSAGLLALCLERASAAAALALSPGQFVHLGPGS